MRYSNEELKEAFDRLTEGMENWKMPIKAKIRLYEWYLMEQACIHFTGSELYQTFDLGEGWIEVYADGYYLTIGS